MTIKEAIQELEAGKWWDYKLRDALDVVIEALCEKQIAEEEKLTESNEPLSLDDLSNNISDYPLSEPVYISLLAFNGIPYDFSFPAVVDRRYDTQTDAAEIVAVAGAGEGLLYREKDYGKTWIAYRHRPKTKGD